jgi:hypothetical protein
MDMGELKGKMEADHSEGGGKQATNLVNAMVWQAECRGGKTG